MKNKIEEFSQTHDVTWGFQTTHGPSWRWSCYCRIEFFRNNQTTGFQPTAVWYRGSFGACSVQNCNPLYALLSCHFYSPPSRTGHQIQQGILQEHIFEVMQLCCAKYKSPQYFFGGDLNKDTLDDIISLDGFQQVVSSPNKRRQGTGCPCDKC